MAILVFQALAMYWKTIFVVLYPLALLPVFLFNNIAALRCLYVVLLMAGYWVFEVLPLPITSLIPMVLFPLMSIMDADKVSLSYLKETNMMFVGGLIIAISVEHCNLHRRIALHTIRTVGCSPKKLNFGLVTITMLVSMWISNTAATAMMIPIVEATLLELEEQGIGQMYEAPELGDASQLSPDEAPERRPTNGTMCYFMSTAYAACIGGNGCIVGSGTNLTFKGIYESRFQQGDGVDFVKWLMLNVPMMFIMMYLTLIFLQFWYMGLFRPNSQDAKRIQVGDVGEEVAKQVIDNKLEELGPMSFHEKAVGVHFVLAVLLWIFRKPEFIPGWVEFITTFKVKDSTPAIIVVLLLFVVPSKPDFIHMFSSDEEQRPKASSPALLTWKVVQQKVHWGLVFLLGGGFAIADASKASGMSQLIADSLYDFTRLPPYYLMLITCLLAMFITQFAANVAVANIVLPVLAEIAVTARIHPMYLMMPASLSCSFSYCLPISTPPMAIAAAPCNMSTIAMIKVGICVCIISSAVLYSVFPFLGALIWDFDTFPDWALADAE